MNLDKSQLPEQRFQPYSVDCPHCKQMFHVLLGQSLAVYVDEQGNAGIVQQTQDAEVKPTEGK